MSDEIRVPEVQPQITFIFDLVARLVDGRLQIPKFQRAFVWRPRQVLDLLDSIRKQYPIGSLLAWQTDDRLKTLSKVGPLVLKTPPAGRVSFILDGHQRLSTIAGALASEAHRDPENSEAVWRIIFNARDETFEHLGDRALESHEFPMSRLINTADYLDECARILAADPQAGRVYVERISSLLDSFRNYKIPVIEIQETGAREAVEIFARLNSKGQAMTADQMVSALLYNEDSVSEFDLAEHITQARKVLSQFGFGNFSRDHILRALLASVREDIYQTDWTRMSKNKRDDVLAKMKDALPRLNESLAKAGSFLNDELGVTNQRLLPYALQIVVLSSFFYAQPQPSPVQLTFMTRWFWVTSFTEWFGHANPSRVNAMVREVMDVLPGLGEYPKLRSVDLEAEAISLPRAFDMRSARVKSLLLVLLSLEPRDASGTVIQDAGNRLLTQGPSGVGYVVATASSLMLSSPGNRILTFGEEGPGQARNWIVDLPRNAKEVLASHAISETALEFLLNRQHDAFVEERLRTFGEKERQFLIERGVNVEIATVTASDPILPGFGFDSDDLDIEDQ